MAGRTLEDVFDYFVPVEEQRTARANAAKRTQSAAGPVTRWCLAVDPERLLSCALAVDLAAGLARDGRDALVVSSFERPRLAPKADWRVADVDGLGAVLDAHPDAHAIVAVRADEVAGALAALGTARLAGVLLSADPGPRGLRGALGQLRRVTAPRGLRIGLVLLGAAQHDADAAFRRLEGAAHRQLGRGVEALGSLCSDEATRRALLRGRSTLELDPDAESARQILALCERLRGAPQEAA